MIDCLAIPSIDSPIYETKVNWLKDHFWATPPNTFPYTITAVTSSTTVTLPAVQISAPEYTWAAILGVAEAIKAQAEPEVLEKYRSVLGRANVTIELIENENKRAWRSIQLRQDDQQKGEATKMTTIQLVATMVSIKKRCEKQAGRQLGADKIAAEWNSNVKMAKSSDAVKGGLIDAALTVHSRMLSVPSIADLVVWADATCEPPIFDSIYKLEAIIKKAGTPEMIRWCVAGIIDMVLNLGSTPGEVALRQITGRGMPGGKGKVDLLMGKRELAKCLATYSEEKQVSAMLNSKFSLWHTGVDKYRRDVGKPFDVNEEKADVTWISTIGAPGQAMLQLWEDVQRGWREGEGYRIRRRRSELDDGVGARRRRRRRSSTTARLSRRCCSSGGMTFSRDAAGEGMRIRRRRMRRTTTTTPLAPLQMSHLSHWRHLSLSLLACHTYNAIPYHT